MYTCVYIYVCTDLSIRIYIYINVHRQTFQGKSKLEEDNPGGLVLLLFSIYIGLFSSETMKHETYTYLYIYVHVDIYIVICIYIHITIYIRPYIQKYVGMHNLMQGSVFVNVYMCFSHV